MDKKTILIVDDTAEDVTAFRDIFADKYSVDNAVTGRQALGFLRESLPDLILIHVSLPDMDGFELYVQMKKDCMVKGIPVVFCGYGSNHEMEARGLLMGAVDFIKKPFVPEIIFSRITNVLEMTEYTRKIELAANQDSLTELWNRTYLENKVKEYLSNDQAVGMLLILDLDNFKSINDTYGHIIGDSVLIRFAEILRMVIRKDDLACRIGGDEFILFLKGITSREQGIRKAEEILMQAESCIRDAGALSSNASVSIGIAIVPQDGTEYRQLYQNADRALYYMKQNGKSGYHFYSSENDADALEKSNPSTCVDLQQLRSLVGENCYAEGAFQVEYDGFRRIFQFVSRCIDRTRQNVQMLLLTAYENAGNEVEVQEMNEAMLCLENSIRISLRRGDVANRFSNSQFIVILMDSTLENGELIAKRIWEKYKGNAISQKINLKYDIQELKKQDVAG